MSSRPETAPSRRNRWIVSFWVHPHKNVDGTIDITVKARGPRAALRRAGANKLPEGVTVQRVSSIDHY